MKYSAPSGTVLALLIFGVTTCFSLVFAEDKSTNPPGSLDVNYTQPCVQFEGKVKQFSTDVVVIQNNLSLCNVSTTENQTLVFRLETSALDESDNQSVVFVIRSGSNIQNWQFPLKFESLNVSFLSSQRTICTSMDLSTTQGPALYVNVFANSNEWVDYSLAAFPVENFTLSLNRSLDVNVSVNGPQIHYFEYPLDVTSVVVEVNSSLPGCMIVSVQNATCPFNDLLGNAQSKGVYQTMTTSASLSITAEKNVLGSSFFVVMVMANLSTCWSKLPESGPEYMYNETQDVTVIVKEQRQASKFMLPIAIVAACFVVLGMVMCTCLFWHMCCNCIPTVLITPRWPTYPCCRTRWCRYPWCRISCHRHGDDRDVKVDIVDSEEAPLVNEHSTIRYGAANSSSESENDDRSELVTSGKIRCLLAKVESDLNINDFLKPDTNSLQQQYRVYGWNTITVAIFYALPAFQLVLAEQLILDSSGNQDICYYNFKCAHPAGVLSAFNNVWSNIGYLILGFSFLVIVWIRHSIVWGKIKRKENVGRGVPHFFGIYYAMGFALMTEGFMSAFYHICPSDSNFQFDTAFMFIIGGLLIVKIIQSRHPSIHANAFIAFFSFAVVIFMTLLLIWNSSKAPMVSRVTVLVLVLVAVFMFCLSFYFFHDWTLGHWIRKESYGELVRWCRGWCTGGCGGLKPRHWLRCLRLVTIILLNGAVGVLLVVSQTDVASIVLGLFIVNFILFLATYILYKWFYGEPFTLLPLFCLFFTITCWVAAFYFFQENVTDWASTPAESRSYNQECVFMDFYDNHDVWHFFSACAMFFSFLFVLTLDDGLQFTPTRKIHVF